MNEVIYQDDFSIEFQEQSKFLEFIEEREEHSSWVKEKTKAIRFIPLDKSEFTQDIQEVIDAFIANGMEKLLEDTKKQTGLVMFHNGEYHLVRNCAVKTILERARISGNSLNKVSKSVLAYILQECMKVTGGISLIKICEGKISAVHGGDHSEYSILKIPALYEITIAYLDRNFSGSQFIAGTYTHSLVSVLWELPENSTMFSVYEQELRKQGMETNHIKAALRLTTSDTGISGANLYPILLIGALGHLIPLGSPIRLEHKNYASIKKFEDNLELLFSQYQKAIQGLAKLLMIEIHNPINTMYGVMKKIGIPKVFSIKALKQFQEINDDKPCTAHDIYYAIAEAVFIAQCMGHDGTTIAKLEENVARALFIKWKEYDMPAVLSMASR